ncbi:MAG: cbb3-type cytochrome c oxidase subunit 3 [Catalinimonas sp.]
MKFTYYLERIHDVQIWPVVSFSIFFLFFCCLLFYVWRVDKGFVDHMAALPGADGTRSTSDHQPPTGEEVSRG